MAVELTDVQPLHLQCMANSLHQLLTRQGGAILELEQMTWCRPSHCQVGQKQLDGADWTVYATQKNPYPNAKCVSLAVTMARNVIQQRCHSQSMKASLGLSQ